MDIFFLHTTYVPYCLANLGNMSRKFFFIFRKEVHQVELYLIPNKHFHSVIDFCCCSFPLGNKILVAFFRNNS